MYKIIAIIGAVVVFAGLFWFNSGPTLEVKTNPVTDIVTNQVEEQIPAKVEEVSKPAETTSEPITQTKQIMKATLKTSMGDIAIEFTTAATPKTVENFVTLAKSGFYDGTKFHRVIRGFMNQGGDPLSKDDTKMQYWGTGGPGYKFADEIGANNKNAAGTISMANSGPNTNGSQFFINAADNFSLDSKHTVFGKVISGLDVAMAINATPTDSSDKPLTPVVLQSIVLE